MPSPEDESPEVNVRQYYDDNSKFFLTLGRNAGSGAIHQPLFLHKGDTMSDAIHAQHRVISSHIHTLDNPAVLDLGCGVGSSLVYLANHHNSAVLTGVTISGAQAIEGKRRITRQGLDNRCFIHEESYLEMSFGDATFNLAYAIESFIHCPDPGQFFSEVGRVLSPGSKLILFDDFATKSSDSLQPGELKTMSIFREHWKANTILSIEEVVTRAAESGFELVSVTHHTAHLKLMRPRDLAIRYLFLPVLSVLAGNWYYTGFLKGGNARQEAFRAGLLDYAGIVMERK